MATPYIHLNGISDQGVETQRHEVSTVSAVASGHRGHFTHRGGYGSQYRHAVASGDARASHIAGGYEVSTVTR